MSYVVIPNMSFSYPEGTTKDFVVDRAEVIPHEEAVFLAGRSLLHIVGPHPEYEFPEELEMRKYEGYYYISTADRCSIRVPRMGAVLALQNYMIIEYGWLPDSSTIMVSLYSRLLFEARRAKQAE